MLTRSRHALILVFVGLFLGWWLYVPTHELLHVLGCSITGGAVRTLELSPIYGGRFLARIFPFVEAGGDYAGRLSAFEPNGDLGYLATDLTPFLLALFPGFWLLRRATRARARPEWSCLLFGASLTPALSPLLSLTGDAYEIGSLLLTSLPVLADQRAVLLGDDLFLVVRSIDSPAQLVFCGAAAGIGLVWAVSMLHLSAAVARHLGEPGLPTDRSSDA